MTISTVVATWDIYLLQDGGGLMAYMVCQIMWNTGQTFHIAIRRKKTHQKVSQIDKSLIWYTVYIPTGPSVRLRNTYDY